MEEAKSAFYDENARVIYDPDHSQEGSVFYVVKTDFWPLFIIKIS